MITQLLFSLMIMAEPSPAPGFLALGDSYTVGEGLNQSLSWPYQLDAALKTKGLIPATAGTPEVLARTGWTTDELSSALSSARSHLTKLAHCYPMVTLSIGVNDQYRGRPVARFAQEFDHLLASAIELAGGDPRRVLVVSIPDWGDSPFALGAGANRRRISQEIDQYNAQKQRLSQQHGVNYVDITEHTRQAAHHQYAPDGLHPGEPVYQRWAQDLTAPAAQILSLPEPCSSNP